jgi:hypothetical protein
MTRKVDYYAVFKVCFNQYTCLVSMAEWNHTDPFPNSEVKRSHGDDSWGVAPCQNSSMPSLLFIEEALVE